MHWRSFRSDDVFVIVDDNGTRRSQRTRQPRAHRLDVARQ